MSRMPELLLRHRYDQRPDFGPATTVAVASDELSPAVLALVALFPVGGSAILLDVQ